MVQVDPIKTTLKAPGSMLLKLKCDGPVSNFGYNFNLRRYTLAAKGPPGSKVTVRGGKLLSDTPASKAGAYTRPLFGST